ncbi:1-acyl-sn-glycerol-3-phosphate acyltransferase [Rhizobium sp. FY34]|uniref:lysophospholipid acyltransferase family protein n=1 Tax=Rhizobium sp. FY34 TaxID=2562309 RepID=UPI0010C02CF4|nr:1-acyl-sn-glycerol-3-phosphate acyltransferase [Rhizobium sp. FY34]
MINRLRIGVIFVTLSLVTLFLIPLQLLALWLDWPLRRTLPRLWHRIACHMLGIRIRQHGRLESRRPLMLAANHASWKDILVLGAVADVVFIAKAEVAGWPVFGLLARLQKTIFVVREQKRKAGEQVNEIADRLAARELVVLFPEGTTSDGNRLLEVKSSLFGAAAAAVPGSPEGVVYVQPVSIAYTGFYGMPMGRYHRPIAAWPGDIEMVPHLMGVLKAEALEVDVDFGEVVEFRAETHRKVAGALVVERLRNMLRQRLYANNR